MPPSTISVVAPPGGFDIQYCRSLGYWATRFLLDGGTEALAAIQGAGWFQSRSGIYSTRRRARFAFATRTSTRRRTGRSTLT